jgi:hypothetical protein
MDRLVAINEVELGEGHDAVAVERGLEGEVKPAQGLDGDQPAHLQGGPDASPLPQGQFLAEQGVDGFQGRDLAALDPAQDVLDHFQSARHVETDQVAADAVERGGAGRRIEGGRGHWTPCRLARRRPIAS